jgi:4'-phosphopantetheinyl transferase
MISSPDQWLPAPSRPRLERDEVHIWRAALNQEPAQVRIFSDSLAPDERQRASRFHFQHHREHFIVARGVLRFILSRYLDSTPELIRFSYNRYGKPALDTTAGDESLRFNVSHSGGLALYAVTRDHEIGLDIEAVRADFASLEIAERFFSASEVATLSALPAEQQTAAFFNCWTRKEAYIKALGEGLSHSLQSFAVSLIPGELAALLSSEEDPAEPARWSLVELHPGAGYAAALAFEGALSAVRLWQWSKME